MTATETGMNLGISPSDCQELQQRVQEVIEMNGRERERDRIEREGAVSKTEKL